MRNATDLFHRTSAAAVLIAALVTGCTAEHGTVQSIDEGPDAVDARGKAVQAAPAGSHAAPGDAAVAAVRTTAVTIDNFAFAPKVIVVEPGATVTWTNRDDVPHTATSSAKPRAFDSGSLDTDQSFSFTFTQPGTYAYFCAVHPHMTGTVIVRAASATAAGQTRSTSFFDTNHLKEFGP